MKIGHETRASTSSTSFLGESSSLIACYVYVLRRTVSRVDKRLLDTAELSQ